MGELSSQSSEASSSLNDASSQVSSAASTAKQSLESLAGAIRGIPSGGASVVNSLSEAIENLTSKKHEIVVEVKVKVDAEGGTVTEQSPDANTGTTLGNGS